MMLKISVEASPGFMIQLMAVYDLSYLRFMSDEDQFNDWFQSFLSNPHVNSFITNWII